MAKEAKSDIEKRLNIKVVLKNIKKSEMPIDYQKYWDFSYWPLKKFFSLEITSLITNKTRAFYLSRSFKEGLLDALNFLTLCASWTIKGDGYDPLRNHISKAALQSLRYVFDQNLGDFLHGLYVLWKEYGTSRTILGTHMAEIICRFPEAKEETIKLMLLEEGPFILSQAKNHPAAKSLVAFS